MFEKMKEQYKLRLAETQGMSDAEKKQYMKDLYTNQKGYQTARRIYKAMVIFGLAGVSLVILYFIFGPNQVFH